MLEPLVGRTISWRNSSPTCSKIAIRQIFYDRSFRDKSELVSAIHFPDHLHCSLWKRSIHPSSRDTSPRICSPTDNPTRRNRISFIPVYPHLAPFVSTSWGTIFHLSLQFSFSFISVKEFVD